MVRDVTNGCHRESLFYFSNAVVLHSNADVAAKRYFVDLKSHCFKLNAGNTKLRFRGCLAFGESVHVEKHPSINVIVKWVVVHQGKDFAAIYVKTVFGNKMPH